MLGALLRQVYSPAQKAVVPTEGRHKDAATREHPAGQHLMTSLVRLAFWEPSADETVLARVYAESTDCTGY